MIRIIMLIIRIMIKFIIMQIIWIDFDNVLITFLIARTTFFLFLGSLSTQLQAALGAQQWLILYISDDGDDDDDNDGDGDDGDLFTILNDDRHIVE